MSKPKDKELRPIILVTGANSGVGFGICQRLIVQLSSPTPSDTLPFHHHSVDTESVTCPPTPFAAPNGCTIILACRNPIKAHKARYQLLQLLKWIENLPEHVDTPTGPPESWAYSFDVSCKDDKLVDPQDENDIRASIPHEDADAALVAHAQENNVRRRRQLRKAAAVAEDANQTDTADSETEGQEPSSSSSNWIDRNASMESRTKRANAKFRRRFCQATRIEFVPLDLGSMASALECARIVRTRYPHVTHLILNAGSSAWTGIDWLHATWMMLTQFRHAVTWPAYKMQRAGDKSDDGYGWVWQCNVGSHWILVRALLGCLRASPYSVASRIVWTSSLEAFSHYYDASDYQCTDAVKSRLPYESTKYQCELAAYGLDDALQMRTMRTHPATPRPDAEPTWRSTTTTTPSPSAPQVCLTDTLTPASHALSAEQEPRSFLAHPGVVASSMMSEMVSTWLSSFVVWAFYLARLFGSPHHLIDPFKGAVSVSHVCLAPAESLTTEKRYGSRSDRWGREYVGMERIDDWREDLGGAGPGVGARLALSGIAPPYATTTTTTTTTATTLSGDAQGRVLGMSRQYVGFLEKMAKQVWQNAQTGDLLPWSSLTDDELVDITSPDSTV